MQWSVAVQIGTHRIHTLREQHLGRLCALGVGGVVKTRTSLIVAQGAVGRCATEQHDTHRTRVASDCRQMECGPLLVIGCIDVCVGPQEHTENALVTRCGSTMKTCLTVGITCHRVCFGSQESFYGTFITSFASKVKCSTTIVRGRVHVGAQRNERRSKVRVARESAHVNGSEAQSRGTVQINLIVHVGNTLQARHTASLRHAVKRSVAVLVGGVGGRTNLEQEGDDVCIATTGSLVERCGSIDISCVDLGAFLVKGTHTRNTPGESCCVKWTQLVAIGTDRGVGTLVQQQLNTRRVCSPARVHQCGGTHQVLGIHLSTVLKKEFHHSEIASNCCIMERRVSCLVSSSAFTSVGKEKTCTFILVSVRSMMQGSCTFLVPSTNNASVCAHKTQQ
mmetsp:Transcript_52600/g.132276  ORF Transcript_52600/g.132276 Transcript_52600/m.132276 type:complete len:393 (-) Transcript_52600:265-1443(-)